MLVLSGHAVLDHLAFVSSLARLVANRNHGPED
jgi:hypothetical protein